MITKRIGNCSIRMDMTVAENLREKLRKLQGARAEVGLFSNKARREDATREEIRHTVNVDFVALNNPTLGAIHEFGSTKKGIPERSFLRMPLMTRLFPAVRKIDWVDLIHRKGVAHALGIVGVVAEGVIHDAFATGGWGIWPKLKAWTIRRKGHNKILIETTQMEKAISSRVVIP